ncbi:carbon monoxide dehydrogenase subunit G [Nisaea acidiphila]|uniref:Carbon monoxide dehydrogenase subunit G n=1 Tax=Nisaea acidiphila TaxID=1862145 RepID=A0A9J7AT41_9PROT|nr:carbon monoxide dehydrogenase subunit G [Nisaea acidiphila]UUX50026.1 carbon monoxide dehydrogenase subunit G [Nisaea acidiphila]
MDMSGEYLVPAPRQKVWEALNDPEVLKQCIPGCEEVNRTSDTGFDAKVAAKVGPVKARFAGAVTLSDIDPPNGYTISGEGKGGAAGFAKGGAKVALEDADGGTMLKYEVNAQVGGKLAQIGARLIDSTAKKMANDFFKTFSEVVGEGSEAPAAEASAPVTADHGKDKDMTKDGIPAENEYHGLHWTAALTTVVAIGSLIWFAMTALSF